jgi:hypothetical protein
MFSDDPSSLPFRKLPLKCLLQAIKHPDAFLISRAKRCVDVRRNVSFLSCHKQMVYRLRSIHSLNLVADMTVVIFFRELCWGAVGRSANLRADFVSLLRWPGVAQITDLNMEPTKFLVDFQVLNVHVTFRQHLPQTFILPPETRNLTPQGRHWFQVSGFRYWCTQRLSLDPRPSTLSSVVTRHSPPLPPSPRAPAP